MWFCLGTRNIASLMQLEYLPSRQHTGSWAGTTCFLAGRLAAACPRPARVQGGRRFSGTCYKSLRPCQVIHSFESNPPSILSFLIPMISLFWFRAKRQKEHWMSEYVAWFPKKKANDHRIFRAMKLLRRIVYGGHMSLPICQNPQNAYWE